MAFVGKIGKMFGVFHDTTKKVLVRGGRQVKFKTRALANADAIATRKRVGLRRRR